MFWRKHVEVEVMIIRRREASARGVFMALFFLWGIGGFLLCGQSVWSALTAGGGVGVGTSAFVMMMTMFWLAGLVLFGLAALLVEAPMSISKYEPKPEKKPGAT